MSNKYLHFSLKVLGFSESVMNKVVRFLMSDLLNEGGCKSFTQESCRVMKGP